MNKIKFPPEPNLMKALKTLLNSPKPKMSQRSKEIIVEALHCYDAEGGATGQECRVAKSELEALLKDA